MRYLTMKDYKVRFIYEVDVSAENSILAKEKAREILHSDGIVGTSCVWEKEEYERYKKHGLL